MLKNNKVFILISFLIANISFGQVNTYNFSESITAYNVLPSAGSTVAYTAPWDNNVNGAAHLASLGFNFVYDGNVQTDCYISPNGFITFGAQATSGTYIPLSTATIFTNGGAVSALGMRLNGSTDDIIYNTIGSAPNRVFVVQWTNAERTSSGAFNFQIRLLETSNEIQLHYGTCAPAGAAALNTQVGIRGESSLFNQGNVKNRLQSGTNINATWSTKTVDGTVNAHTVRTSATEYPNTGLRYVFTPSTACSSPTANASNLQIGTTNVTATSFVGNSFNPSSPAATNYLVLRSLVNTPPTAVDVPNRTFWYTGNTISSTYTVVSNTNSTTFLQSGLVSNTTYYYWVIPYNSGCLGAPFYRLTGMLSASNTTCAAAPNGLVSSNIGGNFFDVSWNPVVNATDYRVDVSTTNTFSALVPGYNNLSSGGATTISITGLNSVTNYYFRVRAVGLTCFYNSSTLFVPTICGTYPIPYFQSFDTTVVNAVPECTTITDTNADSNLWQVKNTQSSSSPNSLHLNTNTATDSDDWFFTAGLQLSAGVTYRLRFKYTTENTGVSSENMRVRLGSGPTEPEMNLTLLNLPSVINTVYQTAIVDFNAVVDGDYWIGFQAYSLLGQSKIIIDDVSIIVSPTCFEPTNILVSSVGINNATITWDESIPAPSIGYQYYVSTSSNLPNASVTPTGSVGAGVTTASISGLLPATLYYVWVRGNCAAADQSIWSLAQTFSTDCAVPANIPVIGGILCGGGITTLQATPAPGAIVEWYSDAAGTNLLHMGDSFTTPTLFTTTTYYAQSKASGGLITLGPGSPILQGGSLGTEATPTHINFGVTSVTDLQSIDIYPIASGESGTVSVRNSSNALMGSYSFVTSVAGGSTVQTIPIGINLQSGSYILSFENMPASGLVINIDNALYPYTSSVASITGNNLDNTYYIYAYNWKFSNICRSLLTSVTATITPAPAMSISQNSSVICYGESTPLVTITGYGAYDNLVWSPATNITGNETSGYIFNPTTSVNYVLTASQTSGSLCISTLNVNVTVKPEPPAVGVVPLNSTICEGEIQILSAALSSATPAIIFQDNFNAATTTWSIYNSSTGGSVAAGDWTQRDSPYVNTSPYWNTTFTSNDSSRFFFTNSDAQGGPSSNRTVTYLESPVVNLVGYTSASISFYHYLRFNVGNRARIEVTTDNGATWNYIASYTTSVGSSANFVNAVVDASSVVGNPAVKFRFYYDATWDYGWAIDNFVLSGNLAVEVTWTPATNLFFDALATNPYVAGTPASTIYAQPTLDATYTGTAIGSNGCFTSGDATITVIAEPLIGVLSSDQNLCANWVPTDLELTGYTSSIVNWEYADNAAFTVGLTTIANTTSILTPADMGTFYGNRYFRAVLQNGSCPIVYTNSVLISKPVTAWTGSGWTNGIPNASMKLIFNGNFNSSANINACSVEVVSGNVVFNANHTLNVVNDVKVTAGTLTFQNNSSLVQINTLDNKGNQFSNSGNITYYRTTTPLKLYDYTYWSAPVFPQTLSAFTPNSTLYFEYDPTIPNWTYTTISAPMTPGKGYIARAPDMLPYNTVTTNLFTASFFGTPNTGDVSVPIIGTATPYNLIGNPYPSAIDAGLFLSDVNNVPVIDATIYLWTHNTPITGNQYTSTDYAMYNYSGGVGTGTDSASNGVNNSVPNGKIASGQAFFIKGLTNGDVLFKNNMRVLGSNSQFFRQDAQDDNTPDTDLERHRFWIDVYNETGGFKQMLVAYIENATDGYDRGFDGETFDIGNQIAMYILQDDLKLSIQGRALPFQTYHKIPVGYKSTVNGNFQMKLSMFDGLFNNQDVYIEDKLLNVVHNLKNGNYQFYTSAGTFDSRFEIRFTPSNTLGTANFTLNDVVVYKNQENDFLISSGAIILKSVKVFDVRGSLIQSYDNINANTITIDGGESNQVLLLQIKDSNDDTVTKKVIR